MTKVKEKTKKDDMQLHILKAYKIIEDHLPENYVIAVHKKLPIDANVSYGNIRNVKNKAYPVTKNKIIVLNALVEVALENKEQKEKLIKITN